MNKHQNEASNGFQSPDSDFDLKGMLRRYIRQYWYLYLLGLTLGIAGAYFYLRTTTFEYEIKGKLLVKSDGKDPISPATLLAQNLGLPEKNQKLENNRHLLKTKPVLEEVVLELNLHVRYYQKGRYRDKELYYDSPFQVDSFSVKTHTYGKEFLIEILNEGSFRFTLEEQNFSEIYSFDIPFTNRFGTFVFRAQPEQFNGELEEKLFAVRFQHPGRMVQEYQNRIKIASLGEFSTILEFSMIDAVPERGEAILNTLVNSYNQATVDDKNQIAQNTLNFIDERLRSLTRELATVESNVERFKQQNQIATENSSKTNLVISEINRHENELSQLNIKQRILETMEEYLEREDSHFQLIPANLTTEDVNLTTQINQYNQLVLQRQRLLQSSSPDNPTLVGIEAQIKQLQGNILRTVRNLQSNLQIQINGADAKIAVLHSQVQAVPTIERGLLEIKRQQTIKENLYLFLLQKREETALSGAVAAPETVLVEPASSSIDPVRPKKALVYTLFLILGISMASGTVFLSEQLKDSIESREDIEALSSIPILGQIAFSRRGRNNIVVTRDNNSAVAEMFRLLRANLRYFLPKDKTPTVLVTSTVGGEGKTFISTNLAMALALSGKRTILLGMDLRNPQLDPYFGTLDPTGKGLSNYLIGEATLPEITRTVAEEKVPFHYVLSGPIPPDPSELLHADQTAALFEELREQYDYIIIDSPPIGLVSDALLLNDYATNSILVVRYKRTKKRFLKQLEEVYRQRKLHKPTLVLNGTKAQQGYGYWYGDYVRSKPSKKRRARLKKAKAE